MRKPPTLACETIENSVTTKDEAASVWRLFEIPRSSKPGEAELGSSTRSPVPTRRIVFWSTGVAALAGLVERRRVRRLVAMCDVSLMSLLGRGGEYGTKSGRISMKTE
jgi:hypothetical protein